MTTTIASLYIIGKNHSNALGLEFANIKELTNFNENHVLSVKQINCTLNTTIFTDNNNRYFVTGDNECGECGIDSTDKYISELQQIKFFETNNIKINKICSSICGKSIFWITDEYKLYANGCNKHCQLGIEANDTTNRHKPTLINSLSDIIDVKYGSDFTIALCCKSIIVSKIISYWSRLKQISIPNDIINLFEIIFSNNAIYRSKKHSYYGNINHKAWEYIDIFYDKQIIKIECGRYHCLYLESNGNIWSNGSNNKYGQLNGEVDCSYYNIPKKIEYFVNNDIKIKDIACGWYHNLAIDYYGNIYSWGYNGSGQCGRDYKSNSFLIESLQQYNIIKIKCGVQHSYAMSDKNDHFLFGNNKYNQCNLCDDFEWKIKQPIIINQIVKKITNCKQIKEIYLGYDSTFVLTTL
eukprot:149352_1